MVSTLNLLTVRMYAFGPWARAHAHIYEIKSKHVSKDTQLQRHEFVLCLRLENEVPGIPYPFQAAYTIKRNVFTDIFVCAL